MKKVGTEYKSDFTFDAKIKNVNVANENGAYKFLMDKSKLEFSFRTTPLHFFMSLVKQLGAFSVGVNYFFDGIESTFQEKVLDEISNQITYNLKSFENVIELY